MKYLYANFTDSSSNFGNHIIDFATRHILASRIPDPAQEFDSFVDAPPPGSYDFVLLPGCTMITVGQNPGLNRIEELGCPVYGLALSLWASLPRPGVLFRKRIVFASQAAPPDLTIARKLRQPIGARDSYTYRVLRMNGMDTYYAGCPTLFLPADGVCDDGYVLMSLGRGRVRTQTYAAHRLARRHTVIGIVHEEGDYERFRAAGWKLPLVTYEGDTELYLSYFKRASVVISGRLHGALPALAFGKRLFYFGTRDSRTTILDDLGVRIHGYHELAGAIENASSDFNRYLLQYFRANMEKGLDQTVGTHM